MSTMTEMRIEKLLEEYLSKMSDTETALIETNRNILDNIATIAQDLKAILVLLTKLNSKIQKEAHE